MKREDNSSKKVSIIMPVYNGKNYLEKAIDSIRNQSYKNWELILINDGSNDNTENIINQYADFRIKYYKNETNLGLIKTLNRAIDLCKGEYIARMDADDIADKRRIARQVKTLNSNEDIAICGTDAYVIDENDSITGKLINVRSNDYIQINLLFSVPIIHPSIMIRSSVLKANYYNEDYKDAEDYELWCKIAKTNKIINIPKKLLRYRWHNTNISVVNDKTQEELKNKIIYRQLQQLNLNPSKKELYLHRISFMQYDAKSDIKPPKFDEYDDLNAWYSKLIVANEQIGKYNQEKLIAYLYSRWIVLCMKQKNYFTIFKPKFAIFKMSTYIETFKLVRILMKK